MRMLGILRLRVRSLFRPGKVERELEDELVFSSPSTDGRECGL
jgi:hypothetical protein